MLICEMSKRVPFQSRNEEARPEAVFDHRAEGVRKSGDDAAAFCQRRAVSQRGLGNAIKPRVA